MEVNFVKKIDSQLKRQTREITPFGFKMSDYVRWGYLVSDEKREIEKNEIVLLKIKPLKLPANTMISSIGGVKHPYGSVLDVVGDNVELEKEKVVDKVLFLATESNEIEEGDLLGSVKIIFIGIGLIVNLKTVEIPKVEYGDETIEFTVKYVEGSILKSIRTKKSTHGYWRSNLAYTETIISDEDFKLKRGEVRNIKIREIILPPYTVTVSWGMVENVDVYPVEIFGEGKAYIEEERVVSKASVIGIEDCEVRKGELLGHVNVYFVATRKPEIKLKERRISKAYIKYTEDDIKDKKLKYIHPACFKRKDKARWDIIVSDEKRKVERGKPAFIKIREIVIPENSIVTPLYVMRNDIGTTLGVYQPGIPPEITDEKFISHALFLPVTDGEIRKGDLLGVINVYRVESMSFESFVTKLESWKDFIGYRINEIK
ncbi:MAG: DUF22 domain-containing protein [Archaeoglobus sp.]|nr:DUF22 domain-containing protein [Archaeoglobus sp.]